MSTNKHGLQHAVVAAAAVLTTALVATAGPLRPAAAGGESDPGAIEQLACDHNLTQTEAEARMGRQDRVQELASVAARTLGERYGGV